MRINRTRRIISLLLLLCVTAFSLSFSVFADRAPEKPQDAGADHAAGSVIDQNLVAAEMQEKAGQGILEIESLREECSKHFQLEDGTYQAIAYGGAVHRTDADGKWRDIDNRLYADSAESDRYSTQDGRFSFAESVSADELYIIDDGQYRISFGALLEGSPRSTAVIENHADRKTAAEGLTGEEKLEALKTIDNTTKIMYYEVNGGVDLEYIVSGNDVKENIILLQPTEETVFSYRLKLAGLYAELEDDNTVSLKNKNGETVYRLTAPYMYDSAGAGSANVVYTLAEDAEGYIITVEADSKWINSPERVFPVTVDPNVTSVLQDDTYIYSYAPATNYGSSTVLYVDSRSITYMKATMPTIPDYANITAATLNVRYYYNGTSNGTTIGLYRCIHDWDENTLTYLYTHFWTNYGLAATSTDSETTPAGSIPANDPPILTFNILSLARQWYAGGTNYGIGLKYESGTNNCVMIHSYEANNTYKSYYEITYSNNSNPIVQNGTYFIRNKSTQQYIDDYHAIAEGESILQYEFTVDIGQRWIFRYAHWGNYYTIKTANSANDYFIGVDGDSTSANADIVFRQGLDSNGTRTMSDGMIWEITETASGAYKIQAITGQSGSNDLVMRAAPYTGSSIDIAIKQIAYTNNTNYKDEWFIIKYYYATINCYYDKGYSVYYSESNETSENIINGYFTNIKSRYFDLLNLIINYNNATYYASAIDSCKGTVSTSNIDTLCSHSGTRHTDRSNVASSFMNSYSGSNTITNILWSCHKIKSIAASGTAEYNRSCSTGSAILLINRFSSNNRTTRSQSTLMHELNHQYGAPDHYHELDSNGICLFSDICSDCGTNPRPSTCIMNTTNTDINDSNVICPECKAEIIAHLNTHHAID